MKFKYLVVFLLILSGCSTAPKQSVEAGKTLVVGRVIFAGEGVDDMFSINMNVRATQQIDMLVDPAGSLSNKLRSGPGGLFYYLTDVNQPFSITQLKIKKENERGSWRSFTQSASVSGKSGNGGVTNFGTIYWDVSGEYGSITHKTDYDREIEAFFKQKYPESPWSSETWNLE